MDFSDHTGVTNNFLHSLLSKCNVTLNDVNMTQASEHYQYHTYLETLMTYGSDAAATHPSNAYWYLDTGDIKPVDPSVEAATAMTNKGFILRWNRISTSSYLADYIVTHLTCSYTCCRSSGCRSG